MNTFRAGTKAGKVFELLAHIDDGNLPILRTRIVSFYSSLEPRANPRYASLSVEKILLKIGRKTIINRCVHYTLDANKITKLSKQSIWERLESKLNENYIS